EFTVAVMEDVSNAEIIAERGDDQRNRGKNHRAKNCNSCAASRLSDASPAWILLKKKSQEAAAKRVNAQREREQQGKSTNCRHVDPQGIFSESTGTSKPKEDYQPIPPKGTPKHVEVRSERYRFEWGGFAGAEARMGAEPFTPRVGGR